MEIKINDENIKLHFGMDFIANLDERVSKVMDTNINEIAYGQGLVTYVQLFLSGDYRSLSYVLYEGTCTMEEGRPSLKDIQAYIESCDDLDALANEVLEELKKSGVCAKQAKTGEEIYLRDHPKEEESRPKRNMKK